MVVHGLYWLAFNLAAPQPSLLVVDDGHWADEASLRWLAYLASRLEGLDVSLVVAMRPDHPARTRRSLLALRREAVAVVGPGLLSEGAVRSIVRGQFGEVASTTSARRSGPQVAVIPCMRRNGPDRQAGGWRPQSGGDPAALLAAVSKRLVGGSSSGWTDWIQPRSAWPRRWPRWGTAANCETPPRSPRSRRAGNAFAAGLVRIDVLADDGPPRFVHPRRSRRSRGLAGPWGTRRRPPYRRHLLHGMGAPAGRVAAHLVGVAPAGRSLDVGPAAPGRHGGRRGWRSARRRQPLEPGARRAAPTRERVEVLRQAARAEVSAGSQQAWARLQEALRLTADPRQRAVISLEVAEAHAALFRWTEAVEIIERALGELGDADDALAGRLEGELVVAVSTMPAACVTGRAP